MLGITWTPRAEHVSTLLFSTSHLYKKLKWSFSSRSSSWLEKTSSGNKTHHSASWTPTWRKCMRMFHSGLSQEAREKKEHQNSYVSLQLRAENCHKYARNGETNSVCGKSSLELVMKDVHNFEFEFFTDFNCLL